MGLKRQFGFNFQFWAIPNSFEFENLTKIGKFMTFMNETKYKN